MNTQGSLSHHVEYPITRRQLLRSGGMLVGLTGAVALLAACGGAQAPAPASSSPSAAAASAPPAAPSAPAAPKAPSVAPAASTAAPGTPGTAVTISAREDGNNLLFDVDNLAVMAGTPVNFTFKNTGKETHELWVYPTQDVSQMMTLRRAGKSASETQYLKGLVGQTGEVEPAKSANFSATLTPGFYELACYMKGQNPDGSTYRHFDKGQTVTLAAVGQGGPSPAILTAGSTMNVDLVQGTGILADSWLFQPDRLIVPAGNVTFSVTNKMTSEHDFVVYPLGDITKFIADRLNGGENYDLIKGQPLLEDLAPGKTGQKTAALTPGMWAAVCFMTSKNPDGSTFLHRDKGQRFTFLVKG